MSQSERTCTASANSGCLSCLLAIVLGRYVTFWIWGVWPSWGVSLLFALVGPAVCTIFFFLGIAHYFIPGIHWPLVR